MSISCIWFESDKTFLGIWRLDIVQNVSEVYQFFFYDILGINCFDTSKAKFVNVVRSKWIP